MRKFHGSIFCMLILFFTFPGISQKMTWTTKSDAAKELAMKGGHHYMNAEFERSYPDFSEALQLDPDFTVALVFMANLTTGETRKSYAEKALDIPLTTVGWLNTAAGMVSVAGILAYLQFAKYLKSKKPLIIAGLLLMAAAAWQFSRMPPETTINWLFPSLAAKGLFGVLVIIPIAGMTFRGLSDESFAHGYQGKNLMRQVASSFASSLGAILLLNRQYSVHASLVDATGKQPAITLHWLHDLQGALMQHGIDALHANQIALNQLTAMLDRQALLIASEDLYRLITLLAIAGALIVFTQRRLA